MELELYSGPKDGEKIIFSQPLPATMFVQHLGNTHGYAYVEKRRRFEWTGCHQQGTLECP